MTWHDLVFATGGIIFALALIPQAYDVWHGKSINVWSSLLTGIVLLSYVIAYYSLGLLYAAETTFITSVFWLYISVGSYYNLRKSVHWVTGRS